MQILNSNYNIQNNSKYNQSFTGIRKVKCLGLYEKHPELGKELVDTFKNNSKVMDFCKKYDVDIFFHSAKDYMESVKSSVNIFYDNISKSKLKRFFNSQDDKITISGWGNKHNLRESLAEATEDLKYAISPTDTKAQRPTGLLDSHIDLAEKKIQEALNQKELAKQNKLNQKEYKKQAQITHSDEKANLSNAIQDLINKTSSKAE